MPELPSSAVIVTHAAGCANFQRRDIGITNALAIMFAFLVLRGVAEHEGLIAIQTHSTSRPQTPALQLVPEKPRQLSASIRMANPFDPSEVFDFPPGTSKSEARESIANLLLQRARDRRPQWGAIRHKARQPVSGDTSAT